MIFQGLGSGQKNAAAVAAVSSLALFVAWYWWFAPGWPLIAGYAVLALLATISVPALHHVSGETLADELEWLERREAAEHEQMRTRLESVQADLSSLGLEEAAQQASVLDGILTDYHAVVESRFIGKKHSPLDYLATARRVQKLALQNLADIVVTGHSLASLSHQAAEPGDDERRQRRGDQRSDQQARIDGLVEENRALFGALTDTAVEVANIQSFNAYERLDTMARLTSLAEIAQRQNA